MTYRWVEHTAELEVEIEASTERGIYEEALRALRELIGDCSDGERVACEIEVEAADRAAALVQWLDELVYRSEIEDLVPDDIQRFELTAHGLRATVQCHRGQPRHVVKGATYHRVRFEPTSGGFQATVILDV